VALDNRGKMTALKLQESAAGYQTLTQRQQEDLIAKANPGWQVRQGISRWHQVNG
jgi:hypothetical protein